MKGCVAGLVFLALALLSVEADGAVQQSTIEGDWYMQDGDCYTFVSIRGGMFVGINTPSCHWIGHGTCMLTSGSSDELMVSYITSTNTADNGMGPIAGSQVLFRVGTSGSTITFTPIWASTNFAKPGSPALTLTRVGASPIPGTWACSGVLNGNTVYELDLNVGDAFYHVMGREPGKDIKGASWSTGLFQIDGSELKYYDAITTGDVTAGTHTIISKSASRLVFDDGNTPGLRFTCNKNDPTGFLADMQGVRVMKLTQPADVKGCLQLVTMVGGFGGYARGMCASPHYGSFFLKMSTATSGTEYILTEDGTIAIPFVLREEADTWTFDISSSGQGVHVLYKRARPVYAVFVKLRTKSMTNGAALRAKLTGYDMGFLSPLDESSMSSDFYVAFIGIADSGFVAKVKASLAGLSETDSTTGADGKSLNDDALVSFASTGGSSASAAVSIATYLMLAGACMALLFS